MQIFLNSPKIPFQGSFVKVNMDDFIPESDEIDNNESKNFECDLNKTPNRAKSDIESFTCFNGNTKTDITLWQGEKEEFSKLIPQNIKNLCRFHRINPIENLFLVSGINKDGQLFVIFNSFFKDEKADNSNKSYEQIYCLKSKDKNPTPLQKDIARVFSDIRNKMYLMDGSIKNPFKDIIGSKNGISNSFSSNLSGLSYVSKERPLNELMNEKGKFNTIIYSADGEYICYRTVYLAK